MIEISNISMHLGESEAALKDMIAARLEIGVTGISHFRITRRSLDCRRARPHWVYAVELSSPLEDTILEKDFGELKIRKATARANVPIYHLAGRLQRPPVVVGCGPAGLFAALVLADAGIPCTLLERGKPVAQRVMDTKKFWTQGTLESESNAYFGEGGAGTFSDGKLTTRVRSPYMEFVKQTLVQLGAPAEIMTDSKPHIGTDRLRSVIVNFRKRLQDMGCNVKFESRVTDLNIIGGRVAGLVVNGTQEFDTNYLILATGQGCTDTYRILLEREVALEPKAFALGVRVEHPQELINTIQYGKCKNHPDLPPAEYSLAVRVPGLERSVYTFCMCPGGEVIGCSSVPGEVVTNGMSRYCRDGRFANSAVVVNITTEDFYKSSPLDGLEFRHFWETRAFLQGGSNYSAPAQKLTDFINKRKTEKVGPSSFLPAIRPALLDDSLPRFAAAALKKGFLLFENKMPGFCSLEAQLIGVETRTSSPVRVLRGADMQSITVKGLYPCGEGSGYAGGIMSSALDGIRAARALMETLS